MIIYDQGFHEMYVDFEREELFKKTLNWIETNKNTGKTDYRKLLFIYSISN